VSNGQHGAACPQARTTCAIIITYHPSPSDLERLLRALRGQVEGLIIADNGTPGELPFPADFSAQAFRTFDVLRLGENLGIAAAQNRAIATARQYSYDAILLFDQDSEPAAGMVEQLKRAWQDKIAARQRVAALGPRYIDPRQPSAAPFIEIRGFRLQRKQCASPDDCIAVDYLIASGSLIPMDAIENVGGMCEALFIDYVDIEWGLRARHRGYHSYGVCSAHMHHQLGDTPYRLFGRSFPMRSPLRHYYLFRNPIWLYRQPHLPFNWKCVDASRLVLRLGFYLLFAKPRLAHWRAIGLGLFHGMCGRLGRK